MTARFHLISVISQQYICFFNILQRGGPHADSDHRLFGGRAGRSRSSLRPASRPGRYRPDLAPDAAARPGAGDRRRPVGRGDCGPSPGGAHTAGSAPHRAAGRSHAGACSRLPVVAGLGRVRCLRPCTPVSDPGRAAVGHSRPGAARHRRSGVRRAGARPHRRPPRAGHSPGRMAGAGAQCPGRADRRAAGPAGLSPLGRRSVFR